MVNMIYKVKQFLFVTNVTVRKINRFSGLRVSNEVSEQTIVVHGMQVLG